VSEFADKSKETTAEKTADAAETAAEKVNAEAEEAKDGGGSF
jgi:hypothetical protein